MATVIDSLLVTLGLDASGLKKGMADANKALGDIRVGTEKVGKATDDTAKRTAKGAKDREDLEKKYRDQQRKRFGEQQEEGKKLAAGLNSVKGELLGLIAAFTGGKGLVDWVTGTINLNAQIGRTASLLGTTAQVVSNWQGLATSMQGTAEGATQALQAMANIGYQLATTGQSSALGQMQLYGLSQKDLDDPNAALIKIGDGVQRLKAAGRPIADITRDLMAFNITDQGVAAALEQGGIRQMLAHQEALHKLTPKMVADAEAQAAAWANTKREWQDVSTQLTQTLMPAIKATSDALKDLVEWGREHPKVMAAIFAGLAGAVVAVALALGAATLSAEALTLGIGATALATVALTLDTSKLNHAWQSVAKTAKYFFDEVMASGPMEAIGRFLRKYIGEPLEFIGLNINLIADGLALIAARMRHDTVEAAHDLADFLEDRRKLWALDVEHRRENIAADQPPPPIGGEATPPSEALPAPTGGGGGGGAAGNANAAAAAAVGRGNINAAVRDAAGYFMKRGYPQNSALALAAMMFAESGLKPDAWNQAGGNHGAQGIAQWRGGRVDAFIAKYGHAPHAGTLPEQYEFAATEAGGRPEGAALKAGGPLANMLALVGWYYEAGRDQRAIPQVIGDLGRAATALGDTSLASRARAAGVQAGYWGANAAPAMTARAGNNVNVKTDIQTMNINVANGSPDNIAANFNNAVAKSSSLQSIVAGLL